MGKMKKPDYLDGTSTKSLGQPGCAASVGPIVFRIHLAMGLALFGVQGEKKTFQARRKMSRIRRKKTKLQHAAWTCYTGFIFLPQNNI